MPKRSNGFDKNPQRARLAGMKSKRSTPPELISAREQNAKEFEASLYKYMKATREELKLAANNPATPAQDLAVIKILARAIERGDHTSLNFILDRSIGKVTEKFEGAISSK